MRNGPRGLNLRWVGHIGQMATPGLVATGCSNIESIFAEPTYYCDRGTSGRRPQELRAGCQLQVFHTVISER